MSFENVNGWAHRYMDGRPAGRTDNGRKVITIAHPEHSSGELKISILLIEKSTLSGAMLVYIHALLRLAACTYQQRLIFPKQTHISQGICLF